VQAERTRLMRLALGAAALALVAPLAACGSDGGDGGNGVVSGVQADDPDGLHGSTVGEGWQLPAVALEDTEGEPATLAQEASEPLTLLFFGYTHCPDICLAVMADVASALNRLEPQEAEQVEVWFVTTDPARDDGPTIREWLDRFDPAFRGFTGDLADIEQLGRAMHVPIDKGRKLPTGGYEVDHGTPVLGLTPGGGARVVWTEGTSAAELADDLRALLADPDLMQEA
jgi:protein SCO1/2